METHYITTPIYYVNGPPHPGHSYTTIVADVRTRFARLEGKDAFFLTGTDEHGEKIAQSADANGIEPKEWVDRISSMFRELWPTLHVEYDDFIRTTENRHNKVVREILQRVYDKGEIYFGTHGGKYCYGCERFLDDDELVDGRCPDHNREPEYIEEPNYYFRMSAYQDWLIDYLKKNPETIRPRRYLNEVLAFLDKPLQDLSISRPKTRLDWGIELPFDSDHVTYVWFDALINYVSALGWPDGERYRKYWPAEHLLAKDILKTHGVYWPCMLKAADIPIFKQLSVHGFWNAADGRKMSKTLGNQIDPVELRDRYGADVYRYALIREMVYGHDSNIGEEIIARRMNSDLSNDFGNLASRTLNLVAKNFDGRVPEPGETTEAETELQMKWLDLLPAIRNMWDELKTAESLEAVMECVRATNRYFDSEEPWVLAREGKAERLGTVLYTALEAVRIASAVLYPVMPGKMAELRGRIGMDAEPSFEKAAQWGVLAAGTKIEKGTPLFPRADLDEVQTRVQAKLEAAQAKLEEKEEPVAEEELVSIDDFKKLKLKVGTILSAEPIKKTDKLLKLKVDVGEVEPRQLVGGIAEFYKPDELVGRQIVIIANLEPASIRGVASQGMLLAADDDKNTLAFLTPEKDVPNGTPIR